MRKILLAFIFVSSFTPFTAHAALTDNIVGYWKMDESSGNAADATGNGYTLTNNNTITYSSSYGKINNGTNFNGTNQYFSSTASGLQLTGNLTFTCWVNPPAASPSRYLLWNTFSNSGTSGVITGLENVSGSLYSRFALYNGSGHDYAYTTTAITPNTWTFMSWVYTAASGQVEFYINGSLVHTETGYLTAIPSKSAAYLGIDGNFGSGNYWKQYMDECGLWSRPLSSTEISTLYNSGTGLQYPFTTTTITSILGLVRSFWF